MASNAKGGRVDRTSSASGPFKNLQQRIHCNSHNLHNYDLTKPKPKQLQLEDNVKTFDLNPSCNNNEIISPQQASNYATSSNCTFNQPKGVFLTVRHSQSSQCHLKKTWGPVFCNIFVKDSTVTTKSCSECYPELAGYLDFVSIHLILDTGSSPIFVFARLTLVAHVSANHQPNHNSSHQSSPGS